MYDLSPANDMLYSIGMGLHHSGVEILGKEYCEYISSIYLIISQTNKTHIFTYAIAFASGGGIFDSGPKEAPGAKFREALELGSFDGGSSELQSALSGERTVSFVNDG